MSLISVLTTVSGLSFLVYGARCVFSDAMVNEFERFGLARFRVLTGSLELLGGLGLLIGLWIRPIALLSAFGLAVLMLLGVGVRLRMRDGLWLTLPALILMLVNAWIAWIAWQAWGRVA